MRHPAMLAAGLFAAAATNTHAITLSQSELPTALSGCASVTCTVSLTSNLDTDFMSVFMMARMRPDYSAYDISWLVRYTLTAPSALTGVVDYGTGDASAVATPYTGHIWLEAPQTLALGGQNLFRVYTDQISPNPDANNYQDNLSTWVFGMDAQAAISGGAGYYRHIDNGYDPEEYGPVLEYGNLAVIDGLLICIECGIETRLNLIGLQYAANGTSSFNPADTRALLLQYRDFYDYFDYTRSFYVQAVPLPAAAWLFGGGLAALAGFARTRPRLSA